MSTQAPAHEPVILVDGSSYLHRAFHAFGDLHTSDGRPTGAIYGVAVMLRSLLRDRAISHVAVVFDAPGPTFRDEHYAPYKAHRPAMADALSAQIEGTHALVRALGLPLLCEAGVEADDVIATWARRAAEAGLTVEIVSGDKDFGQLVSDQVTILEPKSGTRLDRAGVVEKFGVPPELIVDYLALTGDSADNIPGVPGVGPKTARKWLSDFGSLSAVLAHATEIPGKAGEALRAASAQLPLYRDLVTLRRTLDLAGDLAVLVRRSPDIPALKALYRDFEFRQWTRELETNDSTPAPTPAQETGLYETVTTEEALSAWCERLARASLVALDTETRSLDPVDPGLVGLSFTDRPGAAAYVPLAHQDSGDLTQLPAARVLERLRPWLEDPERPKVLQNAKFDIGVFAAVGITLRGVVYDTMLESYVRDASGGRHDLDSLAFRLFGLKTRTFEDLCGKGRDQITFDQVPIADATRYAAEDADLCLRVHERLWPELEASPALSRLLTTLETPLAFVLSRMERAGVRVDAEALRAQSLTLGARIDALAAEAGQVAGEPFNPASPAQVQKILFDKLGLRSSRRTPKGQPSTSEDVLEELSADHPLPGLILQYRLLRKLKDTYTDKLPTLIHPVTGRIHASFHQAVTATGRLSSSDPNLQNIPIRSPEGRRIREAFVAPPGRCLVSADYSQIELRIMAHLSGDEGLVRAFRDGVDVHQRTAAEIFEVPPEAVTDDLRRVAKTINFGLIYGMSAFGLARQLHLTRADADAYVQRYFARYPRVREFMDEMRQAARGQGYVETLFGRRLYVPEIRATQAATRQYAERTAINAPMQGTAADLIKRAMLAIDGWIARERPPVTLILQVHDELVFEVDEDALNAVQGTLKTLMEGAATLAVPLKVDLGIGPNWGVAH